MTPVVTSFSETLSRLLVRRELFGEGFKAGAEPKTRMLNKVLPNPRQDHSAAYAKGPSFVF
jgi:hypothetical protein